MTGERTVVRALTPLVRRHAAATGALVALGTAAALSEGVGVGLFIPLLQGFDAPGVARAAGGRLAALLEAPFASLEGGARTRAVLVAILALVAVRSALVLAHGALAARLGSRVADELRRAAFGRALRATDAAFDRRDTGAWVNLLESQTWETAAALGTLVGIATRACRIAVFALALVAISPSLTVAVGGALGAVSCAARLAARRIQALGAAEVRAWERMAQRIVETLRTRRTIRVFGREAFEEARFAACSADERATFARLQTLQALVAPTSELLVAGLMVAVLWARLDVPGELPVVLGFLALLYRVHPQVQQLDGARVSLAAAAAPVTAVMAVVAARPPRAPGGRRPEPLSRGIALRDVVVAYEGGTRALDGVSLVIRAGVTTAVLGPSGAGKSTLVKLILGLVEPAAGTVEIDGVPLAEIDAAAWRARVAVVGQDLPLFDASVTDNIAYGVAGPADPAAIEAAARRADADAFIRALPDGYATRLGDDGVRLSGGQRQRIALARALLRDPDLLVLDEATNAVDGISAALIERTIAEFGRGRTVVVVSHRAATIAGADDVVVLDAGRVTDAGPASRVLRRGGLVARLLRLDAARAVGGAA